MHDGFLFYYKTHESGEQEIKGQIPLLHCKLETCNGVEDSSSSYSLQYGFLIITAHRTYRLYAESDADLSSWVLAIRKHKRFMENKVNSIIFDE
jgi:hypothetical protein